MNRKEVDLHDAGTATRAGIEDSPPSAADRKSRQRAVGGREMDQSISVLPTALCLLNACGPSVVLATGGRELGPLVMLGTCCATYFAPGVAPCCAEPGCGDAADGRHPEACRANANLSVLS